MHPSPEVSILSETESPYLSRFEDAIQELDEEQRSEWDGMINVCRLALEKINDLENSGVPKNENPIILWDRDGTLSGDTLEETRPGLEELLTILKNAGVINILFTYSKNNGKTDGPMKRLLDNGILDGCIEIDENEDRYHLAEEASLPGIANLPFVVETSVITDRDKRPILDSIVSAYDQRVIVLVDDTEWGHPNCVDIPDELVFGDNAKYLRELQKLP
jgi:hypothetical protein